MDHYHSLPCGFLRIQENGKVVFINRPLLQILGYDLDASEAPLQVLNQILSSASQTFYQTHIFPVLKLRGKLDELFLTLQNSKGEDIPFLANITRQKSADTTFYDAVFIRILERDRFEEELLEAKQEAERANLAKDQFIAALSHELRTPLTPILLISTALESEPGLSENVQTQLNTIRRNAELEARMIDDLLDVTRIANGKLRLMLSEVNIHELLGYTFELVREDAQIKQIDLQLSLLADQSYVRADTTRLQQVFWNLLKNAVKFTPNGGRITVETENTGTARILIKVTDTGIGIPEEDIQRIFDRFEQGNREDPHRFGGLGLGLAISTGIVIMHHGTLRAESSGPMTGSTFILELPSIPSPREAPATPTTEDHKAASSLRILLVEDHESTRLVLARLLTRSGHQVTLAASAQQAITLAKQHPIDLVISDLGLPDRSGLDLMQELHQRHGLRGIALSGYGMEEDFIRSREAGFFTHLVKPVRYQELRMILERFVTA